MGAKQERRLPEIPRCLGRAGGTRPREPWPSKMPALAFAGECRPARPPRGPPPVAQLFDSSRSRSDCSGGDSSTTGWLILYFPLAQLPRSSHRQRSLQKGKCRSFPKSVGVLQMGQRHLMIREYRKGGGPQIPSVCFLCGTATRSAREGGFQARMGRGLLTGVRQGRRERPGACHSITRPTKSYSLASVISTTASVPGGGSSLTSSTPTNSVR